MESNNHLSILTNKNLTSFFNFNEIAQHTKQKIDINVAKPCKNIGNTHLVLMRFPCATSATLISREQ